MYNFNYVDNHIVANIDGKKCLIDTGSPFSFGEGELRIEGKKHVLNGKSFMGASLENIATGVGTHLDVLIGGDILLTHKGLFVWTEKKEIHFRNSIGNSGAIPLEFFSSIPIITLNIQDHNVKAYIDTGAKQSYIDSAIAEGLPQEGKITDFYPMVGSFTVPLISARYIEPKSKSAESFKFAILPESLSSLLTMTGSKAILGVDWLRNCGKQHFQINYRDEYFSNS